MLDGILQDRLETHGLGRVKSYKTVEEVVRASLAVQAQDQAMARYSFSLRTGLSEQDILEELHQGNILRTHLLRPTWHYIHKDDIRWLIALTGEKILSSSASIYRKVGLTQETCVASFAILKEILAHHSLTKKELMLALTEQNYHHQSRALTHLLMMAEAKGLICSGQPTAKGEHTYTLLDTVVPPLRDFNRQEAIKSLLFRFLKGHGPTSLKDMMRWVNLTKKELRLALSMLHAGSASYKGTELWFLKEESSPSKEKEKLTTLLPFFDEALLSYRDITFEKCSDFPDPLFLENGGGSIIVENKAVGLFKRRLSKAGLLTIEVHLAKSLSADTLVKVEGALQDFVDFLPAKTHTISYQ